MKTLVLLLALLVPFQSYAAAPAKKNPETEKLLIETAKRKSAVQKCMSMSKQAQKKACFEQVYKSNRKIRPQPQPQPRPQP